MQLPKPPDGVEVGSTYGDLQAERARLDRDEEIDVEEGGGTVDHGREFTCF